MTPMRTGDDDWFDQIEKLRERFEGDDLDKHIRRIARQEADKRIAAMVNPVLFIGAAWLAHREYGASGLAAVVGLGILYFLWTIMRDQHDPKTDRHLIITRAEDLNRLQIIAEAHDAGEQVWREKDEEYERDKRRVEVCDSDRWDGSWRRVHAGALELERLGPKARDKRLLEAAKRARVPLEQGDALAKREGAELVFWARDYLQKLKQA